MFKLEVKDYAAALVFLGGIAVALVLSGTNPLRNTQALDLPIRLAFAVFGIGFVVASFVTVRGPRETQPPSSIEYEQRFRQTQASLTAITPEHKMLAERQIGQAVFRELSAMTSSRSKQVLLSAQMTTILRRAAVWQEL
jgi:hypothetical protein